MILVNINFKNKQKNYLLDSLLNILIRGSLRKSNSEVNNGDINCRNTEGHTSELAVQFRKNLTNSLQHINTKVSMQNLNKFTRIWNGYNHIKNNNEVE